MSGEFDDLFIAPRDGNLSWYDKLGPEAKQWVDDLAKACKERNQFPNWPVTNQAFAEKFPEEPSVSDTTLSKHVRRLVALLSNDK